MNCLTNHDIRSSFVSVKSRTHITLEINSESLSHYYYLNSSNKYSYVYTWFLRIESLYWWSWV